MWSLFGMRERKLVQMIQVTWPKWPSCPYMVKPFQNLLLCNWKGDDLETWYFMASSNLVPYAFVRQKVKTMFFLFWGCFFFFFFFAQVSDTGPIVLWLHLLRYNLELLLPLVLSKVGSPTKFITWLKYFISKYNKYVIRLSIRCPFTLFYILHKTIPILL